MKKVLLSSVAALAVFSAAAPAFASDNSYSSNALIQKHYVSERDIADEANTQVAAHDAEIRAEAQRQFDQTAAAAVKAAEAKLKAFLDSGYSGHDFTDKKNALEAEVAAAKAQGEQTYNEIYNTVRNRYVQKLQEKYREAAKAQGNYWNDPTGVEDNKPNSTRIAEDQANQTGRPVVTEEQAAADQAATKPEDGKLGAVDQAKKADAAAKKAGANAKAGQKALPKTHAAK